MRPYGVEVAPPAFDDGLGLTQRIEYFSIEQFIAQVKALDVAVLPGAAWCDVGGLCAYGGNPLPNRFGDELGPVV